MSLYPILSSSESKFQQTNLFINSGVAVGSSIGHAIGGFFGGGSAAEQQQQQQPLESSQYDQQQYQQQQQQPRMCENDVTNFRRCMDENRGDLTICGWYLDQLKQCQAMARQY